MEVKVREECVTWDGFIRLGGEWEGSGKVQGWKGKGGVCYLGFIRVVVE